MADFWQKVLTKAWSSYSNDVGKSLIHLGAVGWFFSALAQVVMIASNKDIDKKEKKFLIPQEISDMFINVGLYYTICQFIKKIGDSCLEKVDFLTQKTADTIQGLKNLPVTMKKFVAGAAEEFRTSGIIEKSTSKGHLTDTLNGFIKVLENNIAGEKSLLSQDSVLKPALDKFLSDKTPEQALKLLKDTKDEFTGFKNGVGVLTAVCASILACNIITPIARNITANYYQKRALKRNLDTKPVQIHNYTNFYTNIPVSKTFNGFKI